MGPPRSLSTWLKRLMVSSTWVKGKVILSVCRTGVIQPWARPWPHGRPSSRPSGCRRVQGRLSSPPGCLAVHRPQPASQQPAQFPPIRGSQRETPNKKSSVTLAESNSVAAATCLTSSLGFLATHLIINLLMRVLSTKY